MKDYQGLMKMRKLAELTVATRKRRSTLKVVDFGEAQVFIRSLSLRMS